MPDRKPVSRVIEFKSVPQREDFDPNTPQPPTPQGHRAGIRPAVVAMERKFYHVIKQVEETGDPRIVARRFGVRVADVNRLVALRLRDARRAA